MVRLRPVRLVLHQLPLPCRTPLGNDKTIKDRLPNAVVEVADWGGEVMLGATRVAIVPANHWSGRGARDRRMALWSGFVVETPVGSVYVAGDTGYGTGAIFRAMAKRERSIDVAVLPIGAYEPRWFMSAQHVDPAEAVQIMVDCGARQALGVHWGTFSLTDESREAPREALHAELDRRTIARETFLAMEPADVWTKPS